MNFDDQFPPRFTQFSRGTLGSERWLSAKYGEGVLEDYSLILLADDLLSRTLSWYERTNLFESPRFLSKLSLLREGYKKMAGNNSRDKASKSRPEWKGFLEYRLSDDELAELDEWQPSPAEVFEHVDAILLDGYTFSLSYNKDTKVASCTLKDDLKGRATAGWAISTSDANSAAALKAAVFKHNLVLERSWERLLGEPNRGGRRG